MSSKRKIEDDGRTIAPMDLDGMERFGGGFRLFQILSPAIKKVEKKQENIKKFADKEKFTRAEKLAFGKAVAILTLQVCAVAGGIFFLIFLIMNVWLS